MTNMYCYRRQQQSQQSQQQQQQRQRRRQRRQGQKTSIASSLLSSLLQFPSLFSSPPTGLVRDSTTRMENDVMVRFYYQHYPSFPSSIYPLTPISSSSSSSQTHYGETVLYVSPQEDNIMTYYIDQWIVVASSLFFVGGVFWVPTLYIWLWNKWKQIPRVQTTKRVTYATLLLFLTVGYCNSSSRGFHHPYNNNNKINVPQWKLWKSWMKFFAMTVILDQKQQSVSSTNPYPQRSQQYFSNRCSTPSTTTPSTPPFHYFTSMILGISPHGIFPFALAMAALCQEIPKAAMRGLQKFIQPQGQPQQQSSSLSSSSSNNHFPPPPPPLVFRVVVASATQWLPLVRDVLYWMNACTASVSSMSHALQQGHSLGIAPGGIAEMLLVPSSNNSSTSTSSTSNSTSGSSNNNNNNHDHYNHQIPTTTTNNEQEVVIVRQGMFRLAQQYQVPIIPVYCFGSSQLLHKIPIIPLWLERLGKHYFQMSWVLFFGQYGLPIPFRQRLLYVIGTPILPTPTVSLPSSSTLLSSSTTTSTSPITKSSSSSIHQHDDHNSSNDQAAAAVAAAAAVQRMYQEYCQELKRIFDIHKESYAHGWQHKTLTILSSSSSSASS